MILLDTNVVSELMRDVPSTQVLVWMDDLPTRELFVTAITEAEVRTGIAFLPEGARRRGLSDAAERTLGGLFAGRVLPFDSGAARAYADIAAASRAARASDLAVGLSDRGHRANRGAWPWRRGTCGTSPIRGSR